MNSELVPDLKSTDPMDVVRFTQTVRKKMFDKMTDSGLDLITSQKEVASLLRDMDQTAVTTRKLDIEQQATDNAGRVLESHRQLREMLGGRDPYKLADDAPLPIAKRVGGALPGEVPLIPVEFVPGEKDAQAAQLAIADFVKVDE